MFGSRLSLFGSGGGGGAEGSTPGSSDAGGRNNRAGDRDSISEPILRLSTDKDVYRPGDSVVVTIEAVNPSDRGVSRAAASPSAVYYSLLIERLGFELRGIEKLDTQWFATQKPPPGYRQRRGEYVFMECSTPSLVSNQILSSGANKSYMVRTVLPDVIPPSYKGTTIRYLYYIKCTLSGRWLIMENGISHGELTKDIINLEIRSPLQIWVTQKSNGLVMEEGQIDGIVPGSPVQLDLYWKEMDGDSEWIRANDAEDGVEEGYESSRDELSSISSYNPGKETIHRTFGSSLSLQSSAAKLTKEGPYQKRTRASFSSLSLPRLSVAEVLHDSTDTSVPDKSTVVSPSQQERTMKMPSQDDTSGVIPSSPGAARNELAASEGFIRSRSYNIRMDNQVMLRFSPKNSDSTYYFSDMIGGTLTFFHEEGTKRCLEVSITLETSETINQPTVHPSRRNSSIITKVQSDHHEVVADLVQTSFLFSVPMDGPMSFSTPRVSVQWVLRFEFFTNPRNVDWRRYEHPLLIEGRDKCEWILPITVHAPPPGTAAAKNEKPFSLEPLWVRT